MRGNVSVVALVLGLCLVSTACTSDEGTPTAEDSDVTTNEDGTIDIALRGTDPDGDELTFALASAPANGTVQLMGPNTVRYVPDIDFHGLDLFTFTVSDGESTSAPGTVAVTVTPYVDHVFIDPAADEGGDGSKTRPYRRWADVPAFEPGITYAQKRGTVARESIEPAASGEPGRPIVLGAYGRSADPRPAVLGSSLATAWSRTNLTNPVYNSEVALTEGEALGNAAAEGTPLRFLPWSNDAATTFAEATAGSYAYEPGTGSVFVWLAEDADPNDHDMEISRRLFGVNIVDQAHVTVRDLHIRGVSLHGVHCKRCQAVTVDGCAVEHIGGAVILTTAEGPLYAGNGIEFGDSSRDGAVSDCAIADIFDSGISPQTYGSSQLSSGFRFSNNTISRCGFAGIEVAVLGAGGATGASISDVLIADTRIVASGAGWSGVRYDVEGRGIKIAASPGAGTISNVRVERTVIDDSRGAGVYLNGEIGVVDIHRSEIRGSQWHGIELSDATSTTLGLSLTSSLIVGNGVSSGANSYAGVSVFAPNASRVVLDHNTFADNRVAAFALWGFNGELRVQNNAFTFDANPAAHVYSGIGLAGQVDHNLYREHGGAIIHVEGASGTPYATVADYRSGAGLGDGSVGTADSRLDSALAPLADSPCLGAGIATAVEEDYRGAPFSTPPAIGAFAAPGE